jgi:subtilisin family serine protease
MARGIVVVGALPPGGQRQGFPSGVPGVLAVASSEDGPPLAGLLAAPGRRILTLAPGGGYEFASGSSMASAHVAGAAALLRALDPRLDGEAVARLLGDEGRGPAPGIDACRALHRLALRQGLDCAAPRAP